MVKVKATNKGKKYKVKPSIKCKKAVANMVENGGNVSKAMRDAGYSEETAISPKKLTDSKGFKTEAKPFVEKMIKERDEAIKRLPEVRDNASYSDLSRTISIFTEKIQLLNGEATGRIEIVDILEEVEEDEDDLVEKE